MYFIEHFDELWNNYAALAKAKKIPARDRRNTQYVMTAVKKRLSNMEQMTDKERNDLYAVFGYMDKTFSDAGFTHSTKTREMLSRMHCETEALLYIRPEKGDIADQHRKIEKQLVIETNPEYVPHHSSVSYLTYMDLDPHLGSGKIEAYARLDDITCGNLNDMLNETNSRIRGWGKPSPQFRHMQEELQTFDRLAAELFNDMLNRPDKVDREERLDYYNTMLIHLQTAAEGYITYKEGKVGADGVNGNQLEKDRIRWAKSVLDFSKQRQNKLKAVTQRNTIRQNAAKNRIDAATEYALESLRAEEARKQADVQKADAPKKPAVSMRENLKEAGQKAASSGKLWEEDRKRTDTGAPDCGKQVRLALTGALLDSRDEKLNQALDSYLKEGKITEDFLQLGKNSYDKIPGRYTDEDRMQQASSQLLSKVSRAKGMQDCAGMTARAFSYLTKSPDGHDLKDKLNPETARQVRNAENMCQLFHDAARDFEGLRTKAAFMENRPNVKESAIVNILTAKVIERTLIKCSEKLTGSKDINVLLKQKDLSADIARISEDVRKDPMFSKLVSAPCKDLVIFMNEESEPGRNLMNKLSESLGQKYFKDILKGVEKPQEAGQENQPDKGPGMSEKAF